MRMIGMCMQGGEQGGGEENEGGWKQIPKFGVYISRAGEKGA